LLLFIIQVVYAQDVDLIKENQKKFNNIILCNNADSLKEYYKDIFLPDKLLDFTYAMRLYEISNGGIIVKQFFTSMPQNKIEFFYFSKLTFNIFSDTILNNKLNYFVNMYGNLLSNAVIKSKNYLPNYLKFYCSLEGDLLEENVSFLIKTLEAKPQEFYEAFKKENEAVRNQVIDILDYGALDYDINIPKKYKEYFNIK
jgi:hypothetical protein